MKPTLAILFLSISGGYGFAQQLSKYNGPYELNGANGVATFSYYLEKGERVVDGTFTFSEVKGNFSVSGKYRKGVKNGLWTIKSSSSTWNDLSVKKTELIWKRVSESHPFIESSNTAIENWINGKKDGITSSEESLKKSWGYPQPGGHTNEKISTKRVYKSDTLYSIDGIRKKDDVILLSVKGNYKNGFVDGNWIFTDKQKKYYYTFVDGYLENYEISELGTGKKIDGKTSEIDNDARNAYFNKSDNSFDIKYGYYKSDLNSAKLVVQKVNDNLSIIKIFSLQKEPANFTGLYLQDYVNYFGDDFTPYKYDQKQIFGLSPIINSEVLSEGKYDNIEKVYFNDLLSEVKFLKLTCNSKGQFLNTNWNKVNNFKNSVYFFQLKAYLYTGNSDSIKSLRKDVSNFTLNLNEYPLPHGRYVPIGMSEVEYADYLHFLENVLIGNDDWKKFIDNYFNKNGGDTTWQSVIVKEFNELKSTSFIQTNIPDVLKYISNKIDSIDKLNEISLSNIAEVKIGNQIWMATDLNYIPNNDFHYVIVDNKKIQNYKVGKGKVLYNIYCRPNIKCPKGWRLPTIEDWNLLVKTLGGDRPAASNLLLVGKGSGFETNYPCVSKYDGAPNADDREIKYSELGRGGYLYFDAANMEQRDFDFPENNYLGYSSTENIFIPCRLIKE